MLSTQRLQPEIQGLRAVAVVLVLLFHLLPYIVPGGYIGVDVFFVISGFVITRLLQSELQANRFQLKRFYQKRLARLTPALYLVVFVTLVAASILLLPQEQVVLANTTISTLFYLSNWFFATEAGYFSQALDSNLLLHTWSLGVEEQFYLVYPLLFILLFKHCYQKPKILATSLLIITVLLYGLAFVFTKIDADAAFFASPLRFFQFTAGGCLVFVYGKKRYSPWLADLAVSIALCALLAAAFMMNKTTAFPGVAALVPTVAASVLIYFSNHIGSFTYQILASKPFVWLGNISYSVYLWHWPLIIFCKLTLTAAFSIPVVAALLFASLTIGYLSWRFVEQPGRQLAAWSLQKQLSSMLLVVATMVVFCVATIQAQGWRQQFNEQQLKIADYLQGQNQHYGQGQCFITQADSQTLSLFTEPCFAKMNPAKTVLLIGDSHAAHLNQAVRKLYNEYTVGQITVSGCKPLANSTGRCHQVMSDVLQQLQQLPRYQQIIFSARWQISDLPQIQALIQNLSMQNVLIVGPGLDFKLPLPRLLIANMENQTAILNASNYVELGKIDQALEDAVQRSGGQYYSMLRQQCMPICQYQNDQGVPIQWDTSHLTKEGAEYLLRHIRIESH